MKNITKIIFAIVFSMSLSTWAQEVKFGKISKEELLEKFNPEDSAAVATYLYKYRKTSFQYNKLSGFQLITEVQERIKIYTKDGFDYATKKIRLFGDGGDKERVNGFKGLTYNLDNGKVVETKIGKNGRFHTVLSENWSQESFTMPNLKEGSVIEYKYKIVSPYISNVDEFVFQHDIPIKRLNAVMSTPEYFNFRVSGKGFLDIASRTERKTNTITFTQKVAQQSGSALNPGVTRREQSTVDYISTLTYYQMANVPALREEPFVNGIENYRAGMKYELSYTKFPDTPIKQYATDWSAVVKSIYERPNFGGELKKQGYFEKDLDALLSSASSDSEKIGRVYRFVKTKVKWNESYGKYTDKGVKKAYKEGIGNIAEVNLMLTAMLRYAGLEANPVLLSTRRNGVPLFPTREGYNYVISGVLFNGEIVLLDATSAFSTPNVLPFRTLNWVGRMIKKDGSSAEVGLYPKKNSTTKVFMNTTLTEDGTMEGKLRKVYSDHNAITFRSSYVGKHDTYLEELEQDNGDMEIENFTVQNETDLGKSAIASYDFLLEEAVDVIGGKIYLSPLLFLGTSENPFKLENREFPVDFGYPTSSNYIISIKLPEGYQIESLPEPLSMVLPDTMGKFKYAIMNKGNMLQLNVANAINEPIILPNYYSALKEYFKKMIEKMNEKVVLSKV